LADATKAEEATAKTLKEAKDADKKESTDDTKAAVKEA